MNKLRALTLSAFVALTLVGSVLPAFATEATGKKEFITRSQHHRVGAVVLFAFAMLVLFAVINAVQQLRGKRDQADGRFRWR